MGKAGMESNQSDNHRQDYLVIYSPLKATLAGGMEDTSHSNALGNQSIILLHCLLCLEDPHINALFPEVLHSGWRHLGKGKEMSK